MGSTWESKNNWLAAYVKTIAKIDTSLYLSGDVQLPMIRYSISSTSI